MIFNTYRALLTDSNAFASQTTFSMRRLAR